MLERSPLTYVSGKAAALRLTVAKPGRVVVGSAGFYVGVAKMNKSDYQEYHEREAARLRRLIANATTPAVRGRLIEQAEEHERLAEGIDENADA
jgi:hypothetical protein